VVILRPEPVFDAAKAAVGSRLKTVTSVKSSDNKRCLIDFMFFSFPKSAIERADLDDLLLRES
jgi:hypothetical protein